ncbi:MAG: hypothetical protein ACJ76J_29185 [Thermoanaerobaculia bacterium]
MSTTIPFDGRATPDVLSDFRVSFFHRSVVYPIVYLVLAFGMLAVGLLSSEGSTLAFFTVIAAVVAFAGFARPRRAWQQNEAAWREVLELRFAGAASEEDVWINGMPDRVAWKVFIAGKASENVILLYVSPGDVLPFHRRFFADDTSWTQFTRLAKDKIAKWHRGG